MNTTTLEKFRKTFSWEVSIGKNAASAVNSLKLWMDSLAFGIYKLYDKKILTTVKLELSKSLKAEQIISEMKDAIQTLVPDEPCYLFVRLPSLDSKGKETNSYLFIAWVPETGSTEDRNTIITNHVLFFNYFRDFPFKGYTMNINPVSFNKLDDMTSNKLHKVSTRHGEFKNDFQPLLLRSIQNHFTDLIIL